MSWFLAPSLETLRSQVNEAAPDRSKAADGTKGDSAHAARTSQHNPDSDGSVDALDITHDPANGVDTYKLFDALTADPDGRLNGAISNGRKWYRGDDAPGTWRPYTLPNKHTGHIHIETTDEGQYDDSLWPSVAKFFGQQAPITIEVIEMTPWLAAYENRIYLLSGADTIWVRNPSALRGEQAMLRLNKLSDRITKVDGTDLEAMVEARVRGL